MEPRIQYAKTSDGVSIAYGTWGSGMPLVHIANIIVPMGGLFDLGFMEKLASGRMLVAYDSRGVGLSERNVSGFSFEAFLLDLEAVIGALHQDTFALWGTIHGGPLAIAYAVRHPERVSHLVLWLAYSRSSDYLRSARLKALRVLIDEDWDLYIQSVSSAAFGWAAGAEISEVRRAAATAREALTPDVVRAIFAATDKFDVSELLSQIRCPTLVLHHREFPLIDASLARSLAAAIPNARLKLLEGSSGAPADDLASAIDEFLREGLPAGLREPALPSGTAIIFFADIADSTALTERLGDAAFREKARGLDTALRGVIREKGGTAVEGKLLGDGVLAVFTSARQAIEAALSCGQAGREADLPLHLGLHAGDIIREEDNVYGGAVNIAARISALSAPGEVLVSGTVRSLARTSADVSFEDRGDRELKGVSEPVRVWAVREGE